ARRRLDPISELLDQKVEPRPPDRTQLVKDLAKLLQTFLSLLMLPDLFGLKFLDLLLDRRELGVDPSGKTRNVWHEKASYVARNHVDLPIRYWIPRNTTRFLASCLRSFPHDARRRDTG